MNILFRHNCRERGAALARGELFGRILETYYDYFQGVSFLISFCVLFTQLQCQLSQPIIVMDRFHHPNGTWMVLMRRSQRRTTRKMMLAGRQHLGVLYDHLYHVLVAVVCCAQGGFSGKDKNIHTENYMGQ